MELVNILSICLNDTSCNGQLKKLLKALFDSVHKFNSYPFDKCTTWSLNFNVTQAVKR